MSGLQPDMKSGAFRKNTDLKFQKENGLVPDGIVGPKTISKLNNRI
jgi:murein L,D-transpeptidase YcbB/YkuD